jgi:cytochrome-b5 reductase
VIIKKYENGKMSTYLYNLKEGDQIEWRGPYGNFQYNSKDQNLLMILCAGTGVAPMLPIVRFVIIKVPHIGIA